MMKAHKPTPIASAFIPDRARNAVDSTVLTTGGKDQYMLSAFLAFVHVVTWVTAMVVIGFWANDRLKHVGSATEMAKAIGQVYLYFILVIVVLVVLHAAAARVTEITGTLLTMLLIWSLIFENVVGIAYVSYSLSLGDSQFYSAALVSQLLVSLGSSMIVAFGMNWSRDALTTLTDFEELLASIKDRVGKNEGTAYTMP